MKKRRCITFVSLANKKGNIKVWLDGQRKIQNSLLSAVAIESKEIAEDLMPQVRLFAVKNIRLSITDGSKEDVKA